MIELKINTVELDIDSKRGLIKTLQGLIESYNAGYSLVSSDDDIQLPIDPIGDSIHSMPDSFADSITLGEMDDKLYNDIDKNVGEAVIVEGTGGEITEEEYNDLFQQDHADQNKEVDDEMDKREREYRSDGHNRPIDP